MGRNIMPHICLFMVAILVAAGLVGQWIKTSYRDHHSIPENAFKANLLTGRVATVEITPNYAIVTSRDPNQPTYYVKRSPKWAQDAAFKSLLSPTGPTAAKGHPVVTVRPPGKYWWIFTMLLPFLSLASFWAVMKAISRMPNPPPYTRAEP